LAQSLEVYEPIRTYTRTTVQFNCYKWQPSYRNEVKTVEG